MNLAHLDQDVRAELQATKVIEAQLQSLSERYRNDNDNAMLAAYTQAKIALRMLRQELESRDDPVYD
jgi:hypothetical protein